MTQQAFCEMNVPGVCQVQTAHRHHRKRRSEGDERDVNLMHACAACHDWTHKHPMHATHLGWIVPSWADPAEVRILGYQPLAVYTPKELKRLTGLMKEPKPEKLEPARKSQVISFRTPADEEKGKENFLELVELCSEKLQERGLEPGGGKFRVFRILLAVLYDWVAHS